jgi:hypothetical protein
MPKFKTYRPGATPIRDGTYVAKVIQAKERLSENGNEMIVMQLQLSSGELLDCILTFVEAARPVINAFCRSAQLELPANQDVEMELIAADCLGRYLYVQITNDTSQSDSDPIPRLTRFLTRETALLKNPALAKVTLRTQEPRRLKML